ncbi:hypothetical protein CEXT_230001 [Caerostris extrusa]|uniref:Uncharacterized protein n=1 Tax=Caerostris extrusa TaxID=172846 RepID=A0AAV4UJ99_CAEEX|nr:hypothetical protein CEXT_230001 [Caerostris extrusa]
MKPLITRDGCRNGAVKRQQYWIPHWAVLLPSYGKRFRSTKKDLEVEQKCQIKPKFRAPHFKKKRFRFTKISQKASDTDYSKELPAISSLNTTSQNPADKRLSPRNQNSTPETRSNPPTPLSV